MSIYIAYNGGNAGFSAAIRSNDNEETVNTLGAGYSYFKKQDIESRPLSQQKTFIPSQDLVSPVDDSANQYSGYSKSSALDQQAGFRPVVSRGYGQQETFIPQAPKVSGGYGQQETFIPQAPKVSGGYGQQETFIPQAPKVSGGYGQQETFIPQQPLVPQLPRVSSGYGQQETFIPQAPKVSGGYGQQETFVPQLPRVSSGYGQQELVSEYEILNIGLNFVC